MTHTYNISGMTCDGCIAKVSFLLKRTPHVKDVEINLEKGQATVTMDEQIATSVLQDTLKDYPKYQLSEGSRHSHIEKNIFAAQAEESKSWIQTYKPIVLIFGYISCISLITALSGKTFDIMLFMRVFMAGFFLTFSFFKMLDLKGFASSYAMYDIVAKKFSGWGYVYAFLELGLGIAFALDFEPVFVNAFTAVLMTVSLLGVFQSVLNKKKIQCACLGAVFNLPMSTVTIIEDGLMILMSIAMLSMYL
ncbi:cation transporter [Flavobacterium sp. DG1-102-2]|uniref:heavy-metal-associated domain-containing protein n=1 Tax=Flavobacterium sp. DG1-102-2 TaxID=3081663 RepID=UPI00294939D6|nr:cation transporter [Flavobacterium sp. DG1-102-2]MDV6166941.1 cation transporter [Flavobacterium sp. DG1-102-2]